MRFTAGLIQLTTPSSREAALAHALQHLGAAADAGADILFTPENTSFIVNAAEETMARVRPEAEDETLSALRDFAHARKRWLVAGSLPVLLETGKVANRQFVISDKGDIVARYDKLHLFDVDLPGGERYRESKHYTPGIQAVSVQTPFGRLGLSICYDLRFPYLYRALAMAGADILIIPAAFTRQTGEAHWHVLQRARAIETGCFVIAAAQTGRHDCGRETFGHSLAADPWGAVLADAGTSAGFVLAEIDLTTITTARARIPALSHTRNVEVIAL